MCSGCGREFQTRKTLEDHINIKSSSKNPDYNSFKCTGKVSGARVIFPCKLCGKSFTRKDNLRNHLRTYITQCYKKTDIEGIPENNKNDYECTQCGKSFGGSSLLLLHALTHTQTIRKETTISKIHRCNDCGKTFRFLSTLKQHEQGCKVRHATNAEQNESKYRCSKCSSVFNSKIQLTGHSRMHSTLKKPHKCPFCDNRFLNPAQLRLHSVTHTDNQLWQKNNASFVCTKCDINFGNVHNLDRHLWYTHSEMTKHKDNDCNNRRKKGTKTVLPKNNSNITQKYESCKIEIKVEPYDLIDESLTPNLDVKMEDGKEEIFENGTTVKKEPIDEYGNS